MGEYRGKNVLSQVCLAQSLTFPLQTDDSSILKWKLGLWVVNPDSIWHGAYLKVLQVNQSINIDQN